MKRDRVLIVLLAVVLLAGCATTATLSPKAKATMILATYNAQTAHTVEMSNRTDLTEAQKEIVRQKREIILKLDPMVKTFGTVVGVGGMPPAEMEQEIYKLIDKLVAMGG
jgi:uncharacterized lipoprotein YajG